MGYIVYLHTLPNGKVYVGVTSQRPNDRWSNGHGYSYNKRFYNAIKKYGWENIRHDILFTDLSKEEAAKKEIELIDLYNSRNEKYGYNILEGGFGTYNYSKIYTSDLPSYDEMIHNVKLMNMVTGLIKMCRPQKVIETTIIENYDDEILISREEKTNERVVSPNLVAINLLIDKYEDEPRMKEIVDKLKELKEKYDD